MDQRDWVGKVLRNEHKLVIDFYLYKMGTVQVAVTLSRLRKSRRTEVLPGRGEHVRGVDSPLRYAFYLLVTFVQTSACQWSSLPVELSIPSKCHHGARAQARRLQATW